MLSNKDLLGKTVRQIQLFDNTYFPKDKIVLQFVIRIYML